MSYPETDMFLVCYSIVRPESLANVREKWIPEVRENAPDAPFILVGLKSDFRGADRECIPAEEAETLMQQIKACEYIECSAKTFEGLKEVFERALYHIHNRSVSSSGGCCIVS